MLKNDILNLLVSNNGEVISGEVIAKELGVSRMAISKNIKALKETYDIEIIANKGYKINQKFDVLSEAQISKNLDNVEVKVFDTIDSTNDYAKVNYSSSKGVKLIVANEQTKGRGRFEKDFFSPKDTGIYMTIVLPLNQNFEDAKYITTAASVIVANVIEKYSDSEVKIKWVNDLFVDGKKFCGILTEAITSMESAMIENIIIGIGINISTELFPEGLNATSVNIDSVSRNDIISEITKNIVEASEYKSYLEEYRKRNMLNGKIVNFTFNNFDLSGIVMGIDDEFNLIIQTEDEMVHLSSGEVSLGSDNV